MGEELSDNKAVGSGMRHRTAGRVTEGAVNAVYICGDVDGLKMSEVIDAEPRRQRETPCLSGGWTAGGAGLRAAGSGTSGSW